MDMVIVGSIGYDDIQTPEASGSDLLGGAAVYSGLAASFHLRTMNEEPTKVGLVGVVGDDFAVYDQMILETAGLILAGVVRAEGETFRWAGKYEGAMESVETLATEVNVLGDFKPILPEVWDNPQVLFCASTHPASQLAVLDQCPGAQLTVLDTFMLWIETEFETLSEAMRKVDVVVINEQEVCSIAGDEILPRAMKSIIWYSAHDNIQNVESFLLVLYQNITSINTSLVTQKVFKQRKNICIHTVNYNSKHRGMLVKI